jgi:hypothetical protein
VRREHPAIDADKFSTVTFLETGADDKAIAFIRSRNERSVLVILNLSEEDIAISLEHSSLVGKYHDIFTKEEIEFQGSKNISMKGGEYRVYVD